MESDWQVVVGTGWITIPDFGRIAPRRDNVSGGRQYFTAQTDSSEYARVTGKEISGGPENWYFEFDQPFWLADGSYRCLEVSISLLEGGRYAVKHRAGHWPTQASDGW